MSIKIVGAAAKNLGTAQQALYQAPADCVSATMATGTVENKNLAQIGVKLFMKITGRDIWVISGKMIEWHASPLQLPPVTLLPGESLNVWSDVANVLDIAITVGEQR